jgi:hypothetical protein
MNSYIYARITVFTILLLLISIIALIIPSYLFIVKKTTISFDALFAPLMKQSITHYIEENFLHKPFQSLSLAILKNKFPEIDNARIWYNQNSIYCTIETQKPLLRINEDHILMENGTIFDKNHFDQTLIRRLYTLQVKNAKQEFLANHCKALKQIPSPIFERFKITWINHTCIELQDKTAANVFIYTDIYTCMNTTLINHYEKIKKGITSQHSFAKKLWRFDVRFKNQIVLAQKSVGDI